MNINLDESLSVGSNTSKTYAGVHTKILRKFHRNRINNTGQKNINSFVVNVEPLQ